MPLPDDIQLEEFDVVIVNGPWWNPLDAGIKIRSLSPYTHALFIMNTEGDLLEANIGGIIKRNLFRDYANKNITVCRYRQGFTEEQKTAMREWIKAKLAVCRGYDYFAYIGMIFYIEKCQGGNRWFCSEWPYWCMVDGAKITLNNKPIRFPYPSEFVYNPMFKIIWEGRMGVLKKIGLLLRFKDVKEIIKAETGKDRKWWSPWSRTVFGAVIGFVSAAVYAQWGVAISADDISKLTDSFTSLSTVMPTIVSTVTTVYGAALSIYGIICKVANAIKKPQPAEYAK